MEESRFWTKWKIILIIIIFIVIIGIIGMTFLNKSKRIEEYKKLEKQISNQYAPNYLLYEQIELDENEYRKINIKDMIKDDLIPNTIINDCDGYVIAESNNESINYKTYLKCKKIYVTPNYGKLIEISSKKNTKKAQIEDNEKPVIVLLGSRTVTIGLNEKYKDAGATAEDEVDGDLTSEIVVANKVDTSKAGIYTLKYTVMDSAGNEATEKRTVIVKAKNDSNKDNAKPVITFTNPSAYQKVCVGEKVDISKDGLYGYTARDGVDGDLTSSVTITGAKGKTTKTGEYTLKYTVKDKAGNKAIVSRRYSVINCDESTGNSVQDKIIEPTGITAPKTITVGVNRATTINAIIEPSNATDKSFTYKIDNPSVATVDPSGIVIGVSAGNTQATVTTSNGISATITIIVR